MIKITETDTFSDWFHGLKDLRAKAHILIRIKRLEMGNWGDVKPVGKGVSELRVDVGKGYRVYAMQRGSEVVLLLSGGNKKTQKKDIDKALQMAKELK